MKKNLEKIRLAGIAYDSIVDGPGLRLTIFTQGCPHHCKGCHNPETWSVDGGKDYNIKEILDIMEEYKNVYSGITFSGGEPLLWAKHLLIIAQHAKSIGWNIWCYTGHTIENIIELQDIQTLFNYIDVLVDGPFILEQRSLECKWRGSTNQRLIDVQKTLQQGEIVLYDKD
jgi:anaerobic ribonucleoside-triphosphate reductase activating protein